MILARRIGERIIIGEGENTIVLTVIDCRGNIVRLGFEADTKIPIDREEVRKQKQGEAG